MTLRERIQSLSDILGISFEEMERQILIGSYSNLKMSKPGTSYDFHKQFMADMMERSDDISM